MVINLFRRFQQPLMILITIFTIISFVVFYNSNRFMDRGSGDHVGSIYGTPVTMSQAQKVMRKFDLAQELGLGELLQALAVRRDNQAKENFLWNTFVLRHEAAQLGVEPTNAEVEDAIKAMPVFQTRGVYDSIRYVAIVGGMGRLGMSGDDLEDIIRDDLRVKKLRVILESTAPPSQAELRTAFEGMYQKADVSVIRLKIDDFIASIKLSDEDLKKLYEERKIGLKTDETRKVKYVAFILPTTDKPLEGPARAEELQKLQKKAENFTVEMTEKNAKFDEVAAKAEVKVEETPAFAQAKPPAELARQVATAAFTLNKNQPNSDAVESDRGYYVVQLEDITPGRPLTFEEAKDRLSDELKHERAQEAMNLKATEIRNKIAADMKAGKSFAEAAQAAAGGKPEDFPPFSAEDLYTGKFADKPDGPTIMHTADSLNIGDTSMLVPTEKGGVMVHLDKREPVDEAKFKAELPRVTEGVAQTRANVLFQEWLKLRRAAAQLKGASRS